MHELGHNLGFEHGGKDKANYKPNYFSIMNYMYQFDGVRRAGSQEPELDYSRVGVAALYEGTLNVAAGMAPLSGSGSTEADLANYQVRICTSQNTSSELCYDYEDLVGNASGPLEFGGVTDPLTGNTRADLNGDGNMTTWYLEAQNDWENLLYTGGRIGDMISAQSEPEVATCSPPPAAR